MSILTTTALSAVIAACGSGFGVSADRLKAVALVESRGGDPLVIGINADPMRGLPAGWVTSATPGEATAKARALLAQGRHIDLGLFQISDPQLSRHGLSLATAFDVCANTRAGAQHLADDYAWVMAHRRYNCGRTDCGITYAETVAARVGRDDGDQAPPLPYKPAPAENHLRDMLHPSDPPENKGPVSTPPQQKTEAQR